MLDKPLEDQDRYKSDRDFKAGRVCSGTSYLPFDINNACPPLVSICIIADPVKKAIMAPRNSGSGSVDSDTEDTSANKMYKEMMNAE